tara:strand:+ start:3322 stop:4119 length:798 start_codon:yes stop_codon:yes gene_type:complete
VTVSNLEAITAAIASIGFTAIEGGASEPRIYRNEENDPIGQMIAPILGDEIRTWFVGNTTTGQQLDLVELTAERSRLERPGDTPAQGDLTIGLSTDNPDGAYRAMREAAPELEWSEPEPIPEESGLVFTLDSQRYILTQGPPFAYIHYARSGFATAWRFFQRVLGYRLTSLSTLGTGDERWSLEGGGGRVELVVEEGTPVATQEAGKRYLGSNHFRLLNADLKAIAGRVESSGSGKWFFPPNKEGFAQIIGPTGEFIELYDHSAS